MSNFEFISQIDTPDQKYLAIVKIKAFNKVYLLYKVIPSKDGQGFFHAPSAFKIGETYLQCISLDSDSDKKEVEALIKKHYKSPPSALKKPGFDDSAYKAPSEELPF